MPVRRHVKRSQTLRARRLRRSASVAEQIFWKICRKDALGFSIRRQHPVGPYVLDFYCHEAALAIEFDGDQHDPVRDSARDQALELLGIETFRIPNRGFLMIDPSDASRVDWIARLIGRLEERAGRSSGL